MELGRLLHPRTMAVAFLSPTAAALIRSATILLHYPLGRMRAKAP
jgi:hypothetical protein